MSTSLWTVAVHCADPASPRVAANSDSATVSAEASLPTGDGTSNPYAVPAGSAEDLVRFIQSLPRLRPIEKIGIADHRRKVYQAGFDAATRLMRRDDVDDRTALLAATTQFSSLHGLARYGDRQDAVEQATKLAADLASDTRPRVAALAQFQLMSLRIASVRQLKHDERVQLLNDVLSFIRTRGLDPSTFGLGKTVGRQFERVGDRELAASAYKQLAAVCRESGSEQIVEFAEKFEGASRRLELPGQSVNIDGLARDGTPFNWADYRGKVILVDYWATWCAPCVTELPNLRQLYTKYHERGFEIVGINLDSNPQRLELFLKEQNLPWTILCSDRAEEQSWNHPMAIRYGVMSLPFAMLVDRDGKVLSLDARGPELTRLLADIFSENSRPASPD